MKTKVIIIQGFNTPYRNELFNLISDYEDIDLTLLYIERKGENRKWKNNLQARFKEVQVECDVKQLDYVTTKTRLNYFDFLRKIVLLNPDVVISGLGKNVILINYILFWKKVSLIHWSEATMVTEHNTNWFRKPYLRWHLNLPKAFLFPGRLAKEYHEFCGFDLNKRVFYAPNSVDKDYTISEKELGDKFASIAPIKFLFTGSFVEEKGFHIINAIFNRLKKSNYNIEFHVAGDGPIKPNSGIIKHGFQTKEEIIKLYKNCHVFLMPSLSDCNPLSLIEAAKTGNIILASKGVGSYPELVNGNGYVFENANESDLYAQCRKIIVTGKEELLKMAKKSIAIASEITHENTAASFYNAIKYVTKQKLPH